jgi:hypothetical protein
VISARPPGSPLLLLLLLPVVLASAPLSGCVTLETEIERAVMHVYNGTSKQVTLKFKDCDDETNVYREVAVLGPKSRQTVDMDTGCVDGQAVDRRGNILGTQPRLRAPPEITWDIY